MNFFEAMHISSSGLSAQRLRMNLISTNLANINTTRTPEGGPFRKKNAVFVALPVQTSFHNILQSNMTGKLSEVKVAAIIDDKSPFQFKYDPKHPDADEKGYVKVPNINLIEEMVDMISATRSYEANVTAVNATKNMALKALEIGR